MVGVVPCLRASSPVAPGESEGRCCPGGPNLVAGWPVAQNRTQTADCYGDQCCKDIGILEIVTRSPSAKDRRQEHAIPFLPRGVQQISARGIVVAHVRPAKRVQL